MVHLAPFRSPSYLLTLCARDRSLILLFRWSHRRRPYKLMEVIQEKENSSGARAAVFFLAFTFFLSQLCVNVSRFGLRASHGRD